MRFITNSSISTRKHHAHKIKTILNLPFEIEESQVISAAYVTARYLIKSVPEGCNVLVLGGEGIKLELESVGFKVSRQFHEMGRFGAVVVGFDKDFTYDSITEALKVFSSNQDALMIGCNMDVTYVGEGGQILPGTGCLVQAVSAAVGKDAIIMGKPNNYIYTALLDSCPEFDPKRAVFIGDRLDSDIAFANANGIFSILVETGIHKRCNVKDIIPKLCVSNLTELLDFIE